MYVKHHLIHYSSSCLLSFPAYFHLVYLLLLVSSGGSLAGISVKDLIEKGDTLLPDLEFIGPTVLRCMF